MRPFSPRIGLAQRRRQAGLDRVTCDLITRRFDSPREQRIIQKAEKEATGQTQRYHFLDFERNVGFESLPPAAVNTPRPRKVTALSLSLLSPPPSLSAVPLILISRDTTGTLRTRDVRRD